MAEEAKTIEELEANLNTEIDRIITDFYNSVAPSLEKAAEPQPSTSQQQMVSDYEPGSRKPTGPLFRYHGTGDGRLPWLKDPDTYGDTSAPSQSQPSAPSRPQTSTPSQPGKIPSLKDLWGFSKWMMKGGPWRKNESAMDRVIEMNRISGEIFNFLVEDTSIKKDPTVALAFEKFRKDLSHAVKTYVHNAYKIGQEHKAEADDEAGAKEIAQGRGTEEQTRSWFTKDNKRIRLEKVGEILSYLTLNGVQPTDPDGIAQVLGTIGYTGTGEDAAERIENHLEKKLRSKIITGAGGVRPMKEKESQTKKEAPLQSHIDAAKKIHDMMGKKQGKLPQEPKKEKPKKSKPKKELPPLTHEPVDDQEAQDHFYSGYSDFEEDI
jgi:hypothetical protein